MPVFPSFYDSDLKFSGHADIVLHAEKCTSIPCCCGCTCKMQKWSL